MATITSQQSWSWQDTNTWDSWTIPWIDDKVIIEKDHIVIAEWDIEFWDWTRPNNTDSPFLLYWALKFSRTTDTNFKIHWQIYARPRNSDDICVFDCWTEDDPIPEDINILININWEDSYKSYWNSNSIYMYNQYNLEDDYKFLVSVVSAKYRTKRTILTQVANAWDNKIYVEDTTGWEIWDILNLSPKYTPDWNTWHNLITDVDITTISAINWNEITLTDNLNYDHWYSEEDYKEAGVVGNYSSNITFTAWSDMNTFHRIWIQRWTAVFKNVAFDYCNNHYYYFQAALVVYNASIRWQTKIEWCSFWSNLQQDNSWQRAILYIWYVDKYYPFSVKDLAISHFDAKAAGGRSFRIEPWSIKCEISDILLQNWKKRCEQWLYINHTPVNFNNVKVIWFNYWFTALWTIEWELKNSLIVGSWPAIENTWNYKISNLKIRTSNYIQVFPGWNPSYWTFSNIDYNDDDLYKLVSFGWWQLDQVEMTHKFLQNDWHKIITYFWYWNVYYDYDIHRNDEYSFAMKSLSDEYYVRKSFNFNSKQWEPIMVGFFVKNKSSDYIWEIHIILTQWDKTYVDTTIDLTWFEKNKWTFVPITAQAEYTLECNVEIKYRWNGWEINIADFQYPFTANEKSQAKAVWAELQTENNVTWSMWEKLNNLDTSNLDIAVSTRASQTSVNDLQSTVNELENYDDTTCQNKLDSIENKIDNIDFDDTDILNKIDEVKIETDKIQPEIIDKKDEFKADKVWWFNNKKFEEFLKKVFWNKIDKIISILDQDELDKLNIILKNKDDKIIKDLLK